MRNEVENLLNSKNITYRVQGSDYLVSCLNPEHDDSNPSMRIDNIDGKFNCFSCGFKGNIFSHFGLLTNNSTNIKILKLKEKLNNLRETYSGLEMLEGYTPYTQSFRGISSKTLKHFDAFYTDKVSGLEDRICFPITDIAGKVQNFVCRHALSNAQPKYKILPKNKSLKTFPPIVKGFKYIVLVEGIFDFLNLYDKGLKNSVCLFGVNTLVNKAKENMLPYKVQGITQVFILFDGDKAGYEGAETAKPILEEIGFSVEIIKLPEGDDPGAMSQEEVEELKTYCDG